jgi:hypothetical protein
MTCALLVLQDYVPTVIPICPIRSTLRERRTLNPSGTLGRLTEVFCLGHHDPLVFFQIFVEEYESEIPDIWRTYNSEMVSHIDTPEPITRIDL